MPRKIRPEMALDVVEDEVLFTQAALKADPDAADLVTFTDAWLPLVDAARVTDRKMRVAVMETDGRRIIANGRLDSACMKFSDSLLIEVNKDRNATRYKQFFGGTASAFVRMSLGKQVERVRAWVAQGSDPVLERFKAELGTWSEKAHEALEQTAGTALARGQARLGREQLAEQLTAERDGLRDALAARARERGLPRDWPEYFFRVEARGSNTGAEDAPTPADTPNG